MTLKSIPDLSPLAAPPISVAGKRLKDQMIIILLVSRHCYK